ncbi:MAG: hypothetical protein KDN22_16385 [Verrucomicrobiae bacterium]|nr:hypothetical protein [Verrucomicrobiae bacterium]
MRHLTVQERTLIFSVLAILVVGACVKHFRQAKVTPPPPELQVPVETGFVTLPSINDLEDDD